MLPRVLMAGGSKQSWQIRGRQVGAALGARVTAKPQPADWAWADVAILIKRAPETWWRPARRAGLPIIWDVLDVWRQPSGNAKTEAVLLKDIGQMRQALRPDVVVGATAAMARALGGVYIPHHSRIGLRPTEPRARCEVVAYDGSLRYLGSWRGALERACARLGLTFVINPPDLSTADLLVAFRGEEWDGWPCRYWKSGVKYVNAIAAGRPILTQWSAAYEEIGPVGLTIESPADLDAKLQWLADPEVRHHAYAHGLRESPRYRIEAITRNYWHMIMSVASARCA